MRDKEIEAELLLLADEIVTLKTRWESLPERVRQTHTQLTRIFQGAVPSPPKYAVTVLFLTLATDALKTRWERLPESVRQTNPELACFFDDA